MEYLILGVVIAALALAGLVALFVRPGRAGGGRPPAPPAGRSGGSTVLDDPRGDVGLAPRPSVDSPGRLDDDLRDIGLGDADSIDTLLERPESPAGRLRRLRSRLARSQGALGRGLLALLSRDTLDEDTWEEVEEVLLTADVGVGPTQELVERLRSQVKVAGARTPEQVRHLLREELLDLVGRDTDRSLSTDRHDGRPAVVLVVGVNGTGKTTTVGKLARVLVAEDKDVLLGAADTFRAAAADQLETWGARVGVLTIRGPEGGDPASVAFDAVHEGVQTECDVVIIDTAGRLQNKVGLMDELGKVKRVVEKHGPVDEVLLVLDATTGQNGLVQARVFREVVDVSGIVLTKLDGTAKGGIVIAVQRELGVPVKLVGLGEGPDDLAPFDAEVFVDALLGD